MHTWCASVHSFLIPHSSSPCQICQELPKVKAILAIFSWSPPGSSNIHGPHIVGGQNAFSLEALLPGWGQIGCMARRPGVKKAAHSAKSWRIRPWKQGPEMAARWSGSSERHTQTEVANTHINIIHENTHLYIYIYTVHMLAADSSLAFKNLYRHASLSRMLLAQSYQLLQKSVNLYPTCFLFNRKLYWHTPPPQRCICCSSYDKWWLHGWCIGCARYHLHLPAEWTIWNWNQIPCPSLRWNLKMTVSNRNLLFQCLFSGAMSAMLVSGRVPFSKVLPGKQKPF